MEGVARKGIVVSLCRTSRIADKTRSILSEREALSDVTQSCVVGMVHTLARRDGVQRLTCFLLSI